MNVLHGYKLIKINERKSLIISHLIEYILKDNDIEFVQSRRVSE